LHAPRNTYPLVTADAAATRHCLSCVSQRLPCHTVDVCCSARHKSAIYTAEQIIQKAKLDSSNARHVCQAEEGLSCHKAPVNDDNLLPPKQAERRAKTIGHDLINNSNTFNTVLNGLGLHSQRQHKQKGSIIQTEDSSCDGVEKTVLPVPSCGSTRAATTPPTITLTHRPLKRGLRARPFRTMIAR